MNFINIARYANYNDPELFALWQQGDEKAFNIIYERHFIRLVNIAYKKTGNTAAAEELAQDVFLSFYRQMPTLREDTVPENYLFVALKNRIFNYHRQQLQQLRKDQALWKAPHFQAPEVNLQLEMKELHNYIKARIAELPPQCRAVFLLSREAQLSNKEVAEKLNISVNTVEQHMRKALRILRASLGNDVTLLLILAADGLIN
ncbi:RNA polymerase sigma-70 factor [Chitinophaga sp. 22620]|uniref:RNA polymerase sigma-70 factor n=1 Tax=Chitinophaga sp. 22620 TaxID=3453952 RepID=UPI003F85C68C